MLIANRSRRALRLEALESRTNPMAGELDGSFGGVVTTPIGLTEDLGRGVVVQPDGKVIVGGHSWNGTNWDFAAIRYNLNGTLDTSFDFDGKAVIDFGIQHDTAYAIALQPDGKVLLGGYAWNGSNYDFAVVRLHPNGTLDNSFDTDGRATMAVGTGDDTANAMVLQSDGKIVLAGERWVGAVRTPAIARFNSNGTPDLGFGPLPGGSVVTNFVSGDETVNRVALVTIAAEERIVVTGRTGTGTGEDVGLIRLKSDGTPDGSFDSDGKLTVDVNTRQDTGGALAGLADGSLLVGGHAYNGANYDFFVVKLTTTGALDFSFGGGDGKVITDVGGRSDSVQGLVLQTNGRIVAAGFASNGMNDDLAVARYLANGDPDSDFMGIGNVTFQVGGNDALYGVALAPDGKIVVGGETHNGTNLDFLAARFLANSDPNLASTASSHTFVEDSAPIVIDSALLPSDPDGATLASATVRIGNYVRGQDSLTFTSMPGITASFDNDLGVMTFSGVSSINDYRDLLRSVAYQNTSQGPSVFPRTVAFTVNDGVGHSNLSPTIVINVSVVARNDAPSFTDDGLVPAILQGTTNPAGRKISSIFAGMFGDPDQGDSLAGVAVVGNTANAVTEGEWQYSTDNGATWYVIGTVGDDTTALALSASTRVRFLPVSSFDGEPTPIVVRAIDSTFSGAFTTGVTRQTTDASVNGGLTPIASATNSVGTTVWPLGTGGNTPPTLSDVPVSASINEGVLYTFDASATDIELQTLTFGLEGAPANASIDTDSGLFSWTPLEIEGPDTYIFAVTVTDGIAVTRQNVTLFVREVNESPLLSGVPTSATVVRGNTLGFSANPNDPDMVNGLPNSFALSLVGAPAGASIDPDTGEFIWTPGGDVEAGEYTFNVRVVDDGVPARSDTESIVVTVTELDLFNGDLVVGGTTGNDIIEVKPARDPAKIDVLLNKTLVGQFNLSAVTGHVVLRGFGGADKLTVSPRLSIWARLDGGTGNDSLSSGAGSDVLIGGPGADRLAAGKGDDFYLFANGWGTDTIAEPRNGGTDAIDFSAATSSLSATVGGAMVVTAGTNKLTATQAEQLYGGSAGDTVAGGLGANRWSLDALDGGLVNGKRFAGFENIRGGKGKDTFAIQPAGTLSGTLQGGLGANTLDYSTFTTSVKVNLRLGAAIGILGGVSQITGVVGGAAGDLIVGDDGKNVLMGGAGADALIGGRGADLISGGANEDLIIAGRSGLDEVPPSLDLILAEWNSPTIYAARISNVQVLLPPVEQDSVRDVLTGNDSLDWFVCTLADLLKDRTQDEVVTAI